MAKVHQSSFGCKVALKFHNMYVLPHNFQNDGHLLRSNTMKFICESYSKYEICVFEGMHTPPVYVKATTRSVRL